MTNPSAETTKLPVPNLPPQPEGPRTPLIESFHAQLKKMTGDQPMRGVECALVASCVLSTLGNAHQEMIPEAARIAWVDGVQKRMVRIKGLPYTSDLITITLNPDEERLAICDELFKIAHASKVAPLTCAALLMQLAAGWASVSIAITEKRFVQAAKWAYDRAGFWYTLTPADEMA